MSTRIYVAGPFSRGCRLGNVMEAIRVGHLLMEEGYAPFVPHLTYFMETHGPVQDRWNYEDWMQLDFAWLLQSEAVLRIPGDSPGADRECKLAMDYNIPVFYTIEGLLEGFPPRKVKIDG